MGMDDFPRKREKSAFARAVQPCVSILFWLHHFSLCTWLSAMLFSSAVKYGTEYWYFSFSTCVFALVFIHLTWFWLCQRIQDLPPDVHESSNASFVAFGREMMSPLAKCASGGVAHDPESGYLRFLTASNHA